MAVEQTLYSLLTTVCPDVFADFAEEPLPSGDFVVYQQITGDVINPIANDVPDLRNSRMQITVWSKSRIRANELSRQIEDLLRTTELFQARPETALTNDFDEEVKLRGSRQDFSIWWK
ncbi:DUF3168 domain-containing protein [Comamonas sp.]|uniref:DUF3168 domain-containing protein n=1 Tax=Comamonas sp. TaxID=34028 RepID=UPI0028B231C9|nr:DUF3168 domain-containing protein [Comamonas sp.]